MPRNVNDFIKGAYKSSSSNPSEDTQYLYGSGENALGTQSGAKIRVTPPQTDYVTPMRFDDRNDWDRYTDVKEGETIPLFVAHHTPPVLDYFVATKDSSKKEAIDLAAHAVKETERRFGERPLASGNTSSYATPFTNTAIRLGLIKGVEGQEPGEKASQGNTMDWTSAIQDMEGARGRYAHRINNADNYPGDPFFQKFSRIDPSVIKSDRASINAEISDAVKSRSLEKKQKDPSRQFKQLSLFND